MSLQCFRNGTGTRQHKTPLSQSTSGPGCCQIAAGSFLPRVTCGGDTSQGQRESQVPSESLLYWHPNLPKPSSLNLDPLSGGLYSVALGKDARAVPVGGSPQRPGWVCPEDLEAGPGALSAAGLSITPLTPCSVFGVAKLNRDFGEKNWNSS